MIDQALSLAARQGGVVRRGDLLRLGLTARVIDRRVGDGRWEAVHAGVYRLLNLTEWPDRLAAAVHGLPDAVASHQSAAVLHRFPGHEGQPLVVTVHGRTTHTWPRTTVHRASDLASVDVATTPTLRITTPTRTLFDLAAVIPKQRFVDLADSLTSTDVVPLDRLERIAARLCRRGKEGSAVVRQFLDDRDGTLAISPLERRGIDLLKSAGIKDFQTEYPIPWSSGDRFDVAFPDRRLAIEWDSHQWHSEPSRFQADRDRDRRALLQGWRVLRFTWDDVVLRPDEVIATIVQALQLAS